MGGGRRCSYGHWALTEVLIEEGEGGHIAGQAEELGQAHEPVPGVQCECHHDQLGEDEGGEGDGHHMHELPLEQQQGAQEQGAA